MQGAVIRAKEIKQRLRSPSNAVPDVGIDLRADRADFFGISGHREAEFRRHRIKEYASQVVPVALKKTLPMEPSDRITTELIRAPSLTDILEAVCLVTQTRALDLRSERRTQVIVGPRHLFMLLSKMLTLSSLPKIGRFLGGKDHTTILHGIRRLADIERHLFGTLSPDVPVLIWATEGWRFYQATPRRKLSPRYTASTELQG